VRPSRALSLPFLICTVALPACGEPSDGFDTLEPSSGGSSDGGGGSSGGSGPTTASTDPTTGETGGTGGATEGQTTGDDPTTGGSMTTVDPSTTGDPSTSSTSTTGEPGTSTTGDDTTGGGNGIDCLLEGFVNPDAAIALDYAQFNPVIGSHCKGTNHQEITDIERVVFLGDSVTVNTPPTPAGDGYRAQLADALVDRFGLAPPNGLWDQYNPIDGISVVKNAGDFWSCAKWGARNDDFLPPGNQIDDCFPPDLFDKRTLVITTMGGNDMAAIAKDGANGKPYDEVVADAETALQHLRDTAHWFVDDPDKFPNGVFLVYANVYEFTDGTADVTSCPAAGLGGFDKPWEDPSKLRDLIVWFNEQYMDIAVETGTDMIFMLENFCGHGFMADDPSSPCYRGPNSENWFDLTCIHPTPKGHDVITDLFTAVVDE
jgi:lysophospholipase L1-like esterase